MDQQKGRDRPHGAVDARIILGKMRVFDRNQYHKLPNVYSMFLGKTYASQDT